MSAQPLAEPQLKRYWLETYGCQMNKAEAESLELQLRERGWTPASEPSQAQAVILHTCSVRRTAEERVWGRLGFFKKSRWSRPFRLVLMGCMAERLKEQILIQAPQVDLLVGNFQKQRLAELLEEPAAGSPGAGSWAGKASEGLEAGEYSFDGLHSTGGFRAFVPIMHGCNNFCSYCVVPYVRGPEVSRAPQSILAEIALLEAGGRREITLLGQNVNSYRFAAPGAPPLDFPGLLERIASGLEGIEWVRFLTSHPRDFSARLIRALAESDRLCRHIHLPVQHGSDRILRLMNRGYTRGRYLELVRKIRESIGPVALTTDILIGFPGETEKDFRLTLELVEEAEFAEAFTYRYNPREGTAAFGLADTVPGEVKQARLRQVIELQRRITRRLKAGRLGARVKVLAEGVSRKDPRELLGRTEMDEMVVFPAPAGRIGQFLRVELASLRGNTFVGKECEEPCLGR